jgi:hypothetical protein
MSAPRLLRRPAILLLPRTATLSIPRQRLFSQCRSRLQQNSERDIQERLEAARPLVPHKAARKFTQAGSSRNSRITVIATVVAAVGFYFYNSQTVPVTPWLLARIRKQLRRSLSKSEHRVGISCQIGIRGRSWSRGL